MEHILFEQTVHTSNNKKWKKTINYLHNSPLCLYNLYKSLELVMCIGDTFLQKQMYWWVVFGAFENDFNC